MSTDIIVPILGESVTEATVIKWFKAVGEAIAIDEALVELETEKVTIEVPSPVAGVVSAIIVDIDSDVEVGALLCQIDEGATAATAPTVVAPTVAASSVPAAAASNIAENSPHLSPAPAKMVAENNLNASQIPATGGKGNITKGDVQSFMQNATAAPAVKAAPAAKSTANIKPPVPVYEALGDRPLDPRGEERVKMPKLRKVIATRLKEAQNTAAMLTTFNEIDMTNLMELRSDYKEKFLKKHNVKLGFMSFFVKAAVIALKEFPSVNAEIYGDQIIYKNYYDIGIAVGTPQGLVVPVLRDADKLSFAGIEGAIADFGKRAREGKITMAEMMGGTYTITNGGVFGSLLSTPILNPPQSGILGMHKIQKRPICDDNGEIIIGNMMYVAQSYDHRIIDGREAVTFLVRLKECLEDPARLLIDV